MQAEDRNRWLVMIVVFAAMMIIFQIYQAKYGQRPNPDQAAGQPEPGKAGEPGAAPEPPAPAPPPTLTAPIGHEGEPKTVELETDEFKVRLSTTGASVESLELRNYHRNKGEAEPLALLGYHPEDPGEARAAPGSEQLRLYRQKLDRWRCLVLREFRGDLALDFERWPFRLELDDGAFSESKPTRTVRFLARQGDVEVLKTYTFHRAGFDLDLAVTVTNRGKVRQTFDYKLVGGAGIVPDEPPSTWMTITGKLAGRDAARADMEFRTVDAASAPGDKPESLVLSKARTEWAALRGHYFAAILIAVEPEKAIAAFAEPLEADEPVKPKRNLAVGLKCNSPSLDPGQADTRAYRLRAGPQRAEDLEAYSAQEGNQKINRGLVAAVDFSYAWFAKPARWMLHLLEWSRGLMGNYGWGIILMTLIVKVALHPLQRKGTMIMQKNQEKMKVLAPKLKALQEQYKGDPAKLQQATMRLYKEEGFNPAGMALGCLPMVLQMPVWFALYGAIRGAFGLRQAPFLWIGDLSRSDTVLSLGFWPHQLNVLPILYAGLMVVQSFMTPLPVDPQQRQQAWMMRFMPLMFFFIIYFMPSAFVLYFAANALLGFGETWMIKKQMARAKARAAAAAAAAGEPVPGAPGASAKDAPKPPPITDPNTYWAREADKKLGKGKK